jgi:hypothetical protein
MTNGKLQVDEDGWLYLGRNTETSNDSKVNSQIDLELLNEMMKNINPKLPSYKKQQLVDLITEFKDLIPSNPKKLPQTPHMKCTIENTEVTNTHQYRLARTESKKADDIVSEMSKDDIIKPSMSLTALLLWL